MPEMQLLRPDHAPAVLAFELENRAYFAASIPDRGDDYFARFGERHRALLAEQETGDCFFHVLVGAGGEVLGRVNLVDVADGGADLGYRIAERAAGRGLAGRAVRELCGLAARDYGLSVLRAATTLDNAASQAVLARSGFAVVGETRLSGRPGLTYLRSLRDLHDLRGLPDLHDFDDAPDATARSGPASSPAPPGSPAGPR
ncbi:GNAT family N-acetyltransferase [Streptomyces fagopyri]|uniref:GNAT family N-acetyltransferase n=1 Tax=Streptomyces fagopyri TaxID=2662397 RepID=UPI0033E088F8